MFRKLSESYPHPEHQLAVRDAHELNRDLWNQFKQNPDFDEEQYWTTIKERCTCVCVCVCVCVCQPSLSTDMLCDAHDHGSSTISA
jgi:hypothetical protein